MPLTIMIKGNGVVLFIVGKRRTSELLFRYTGLQLLLDEGKLILIFGNL